VTLTTISHFARTLTCDRWIDRWTDTGLQHILSIPCYYSTMTLLVWRQEEHLAGKTRRPASADRTARRQFQATGQPVSRTQASDAMTSRLPRYEAKCVQRRCFQCRSVPLLSDIKGTKLHPAIMLIPLERQLTALQLCAESFYIMKLFSRLFVLYCRNCPKDDKFR